MCYSARFVASICLAIMACAMAKAQTTPEQPLYLTADEIVYAGGSAHVTARGNVELYYVNHIVTADVVSYDENSQTLYARGNAALREPNGSITRGNQLALPSQMRDAFLRSLRTHVERRER